MSNTLLILGSSSDIGIQLIKSITEECVVLAHYNTSINKLNDLSLNNNINVIPIQADLSSESEVINLIDNIEINYGVPNKIVHLAAAKSRNIRFTKARWSDFEEEINISFKSIVLILNRFLPVLSKNKIGKVVIMLSSFVTASPPKALTHYITVKYALLGLLKSLSSEYADKNIQINGISPSLIETSFLSNIDEMIVDLNAHNHPLKRNAFVEDIVPLIIFLLSKESDYMNGVNIPVTGGSSI